MTFYSHRLCRDVTRAFDNTVHNGVRRASGYSDGISCNSIWRLSAQRSAHDGTCVERRHDLKQPYVNTPRVLAFWRIKAARAKTHLNTLSTEVPAGL